MSSRSPDEQAVVNTLLALSAGIKAKSRDVLDSLILPTGGVTRTRIAPTVIQISGSKLVNYIEAAWKAGDIEGIPDTENAIVKVDNNLAFIWTGWKSYNSGKLTHEGMMVYLFAKVDGEWKICENADNLKAV
jgi:hypothetical protein